MRLDLITPLRPLLNFGITSKTNSWKLIGLVLTTARGALGQTQTMQRQISTELSEDAITLNGTLRALDLDNDWSEVIVDGVRKHVKGVGEAPDDIMGPMVNREVKVSAGRRRGELLLIDIEQQE